MKVKQAHIAKGTPRTRIGDQWTFVALDPDTKLVPSYLVGKRTRDNAVDFMFDLSNRLTNRVQISSDSLRSYVDAVARAFVERQNLTIRMSMRQFTRLTNTFSKKVENLQAVSLHFAHYNNVRIHKSMRVTPAMAAKVNDPLWSLEELVERTSK